MELVGTVILALSFVSALTYTLALASRHIFRDARGRNIGELVWYQIKPESLISGRARRTPGEQANSVYSFVNGLQDQGYLAYKRGVASIIWKMDEDNLLRLYVGIDEEHHHSMQKGLDALAAGMNCRAEFCELPAIPVNNPSFAFREAGTPANVIKEPESLGNVARDLSALGIPGVVIFTMEDMSPSESSRTERFIAGAGVVSDSGYSHAGMQGNILGATAVRTCIGAVANSGDYRAAESLLKQAYGSISTTAVKVTYRSPYTSYAMYSGFATMGFVTITTLLALIGLPMNIWIPFLIVGLGTFICNLVGLPFFGKKWVQARLAKGEIVLPPYRKLSPRSIRNAMSNLVGFKNYRAPSRNQVIPLYSSPLAQVLSFPDGDATLNIAAEVVPQVGVPSNLDMSHRNDFLFTGVTGEGQPIGIPYGDIEHCIYAAGAPNMGKSNLMELLFGQVSRLTRERAKLDITSIWVETKGSGSYRAYDMVRGNPRSIFVDAHNPRSTYRLALEGRRLSEGATVREVLANVQSLVSGLQFAYGEAIADSSREALDFSIRIAMLLSEDEIRSLALPERTIDPAKPNVIMLASMIIAENGYYDIGGALLAMREEIEKLSTKRQLDEREYYLSNSIGVLSNYFNNKKDTTAKSAPPANKLSALGNLETLWTPDHRIDVYVNQFPSHFAPIVLNMGPYQTGPGYDGMPTYSTTSQKDARMALLAFNHMLWKYSQAHCSGWQEQGKRVILLSDEMKDIAVESLDIGADNVVESISKEGRSRGFSIWCASQMPDQVPESVRQELFSFRTKVWFALPNKDSAHAAVRQMPRDTYFAEENLQKLPVGLAVVGEMRQGQSFASPFTMIVPIADVWLRYLDQHNQDVNTAFYAYAENELPRAKQMMGISS